MNRRIAACAASYGAIGIGALIRPAMVPAVFGGTAPTPDSRTEVRAVYGGLPLAVAAALVADGGSIRPMGVLSAGMAAGRVVGMAAERTAPKPATAFFLGVETALAAALLLDGRLTKRSAA